MIRSGRHFLQIPGPTNVPDRVLRAMDRPVIDHRSREFSELTLQLFEKLKPIFKTSGEIVIFPSSGSGGWESAVVNTLSPGDRVVLFETGHFSSLWRDVLQRFDVVVDYVPGDWRSGASPESLEQRLRADTSKSLKAVLVVHNETSTGVTSDVAAIRRVLNAVDHPALLMVDAISSLASLDYQHDEWQVDVTVAGSQKGLMLPPGLSMSAISAKAIASGKSARLHRSYWNWEDMLKFNRSGFFPYTPATNLLYGLNEALDMLLEEGMVNVFHRHERFAVATRAAVQAWKLEIVCRTPAEYSNCLTAVFTPEGHSADHFRDIVLENFDMSLGAGLSKLAGKVFRIGHLGSFNDLMLAGTLSGIEMGLTLAGVPHAPGGILAALESLRQSHERNRAAQVSSRPVMESP